MSMGLQQQSPYGFIALQQQFKYVYTEKKKVHICVQKFI
jgi:hypothetical protein